MNIARLLPRALPATACLASLGLLVACGGGDPDPAEPGPRPTVTATSPTNTTPVVGGVDIHSRVQATFSKPMQSLSITATTFTLACPAGAAVPATVAYDMATRVATLTPTRPLPPATTCVATVSADVQDATGLDMAAPYLWSFITAFAVAPDTAATLVSSATVAPHRISSTQTEGSTP